MKNSFYAIKENFDSIRKPNVVRNYLQTDVLDEK